MEETKSISSETISSPRYACVKGQSDLSMVTLRILLENYNEN